ncbi:MAG: hypothetical protein JRF25_11685 [Deltaproteobacteria bacterium]|nr:hypothetical protein [Deltaproteobacteria bacterium]
MAYSGYIESDHRNLLVRLVYQTVRLVKVIWLGFWLAVATVLVTVPIIIAGYFTSTGNFAFQMARLWAKIILAVTGVKLKAENTRFRARSLCVWKYIYRSKR